MLKGWRTVLVNVAIGAGIIATELVGYLAGFAWGDLLPPQYAMYVTLGVNVLNIVLRTTTSGRVGEPRRAPVVEGEVHQ